MSAWTDPIFTVFTDNGPTDAPYAELLRNPDVMSSLNSPDHMKLVLGRTVYAFSWGFLKANADVKKQMDLLEMDKRVNPLKYFAPSGEQATAFLNDTTSTVKLMIGPNRVGKTTTAFVDLALDMVPCDETWPIFTKYGVKFRQYKGRAKGAMASYKWRNIKETLWPMVRDWTPALYLGKYARFYQGKGKKEISFERNPMIQLTNFNEFWFYCYEQDQDVFESSVVNTWLWDEQGEYNKFNGADARTRTVRGRHIFSLTPHKVEGRPDTGAGSWIHKLDRREQSYGHIVSSYHMTIDDVPDWVLPERTKKELHLRWVEEPERVGNVKEQREGRARYYGDWHETSGLVYDEWDRKAHLIEPFEIPHTWTRYRAIDHGSRNPTACLWFAVTPDYDVIVYDEYYVKNKVIAEHARGIIEQSGNVPEPFDNYFDAATGIDFRRYQESEKVPFAKTVLDSRSFSQKEMGREIGWLYRAYGIRVQKASGAFSDQAIPAVKDLLHVDPSRRHRVTKEPGAPRLYVFSNLKHFIDEIEHYIWVYDERDTNDPKESPRKLNDHLMSCLQYGVQIPMRYMGMDGQSSVALGEGDGLRFVLGAKNITLGTVKV